MIVPLIAIIRALLSWVIPQTFETSTPAYRDLPGTLRPERTTLIKTWEMRRGRATEIGQRYAGETVHACPPAGAAVTPCCNRIPFELSRGDRMTLDARLITCKGAKA
ncbi:MAG: hypothetical protein AB7T06_40090 [Kofleriaceae bacterium]